MDDRRYAPLWGSLMILDIGLAARVVEGVRAHTSQRTGCQTWDARGIASALKATEGSPGSVLASALLAAEDDKCRTPNAATFAAHWPRNAETAPPAPSHTMRCPEHGEPYTSCGQCKSGDYVGMPDTARQALAEAIEAGKSAIPFRERKPYSPKGAKKS